MKLQTQEVLHYFSALRHHHLRQELRLQLMALLVIQAGTLYKVLFALSGYVQREIVEVCHPCHVWQLGVAGVT